MNRNRKLKNKMMTGLAVSMAAVMGAMPVYAAGENEKEVSKEETVYVNADAAGKEKNVTVSNWLKNAGTKKTLKDRTDLKDIKNVKGDETYTESGNSVTWNTEGQDIYYQGKTRKDLPVTVNFTYYLDGKKMNPEDLAGKSGHLQIRIKYENHAKQTVKVDGKEETLYSPFVMLTGLILPEETFSNVVIDNGKVISDGNRNIVLGIATPGLKESLGLDKKLNKGSDSEGINLPENLEVSADVKNFSMDPTFTIALTDVMKELKTDDITDMDKLKDALNDLEDAALKLVDGSAELSKGADTLDDKYKEFDDGVNTLKSGIETLDSGAAQLADGIGSYTDGVDQLDDGIQTYLGSSGVLTGKVTEYVNGVSTVVNGVKQYADGAVKLADGTAAYIGGEKQLAAGAEGLRPLVSGLTEIKGAIEQLNSVLDGKGSTKDDIRLAADTLAAGTQQLKDTLDTAEINDMMALIDQMTGTGQELIGEAEGLSSVMQEKIAKPVGEMMAAGENLKAGLGSLQSYLTTIQTEAAKAVAQAEQMITDSVNGSIDEKNAQLQSSAQNAAQNAEDAANAQLQAARDALDAQIAASDDEAVKSALEAAKGQLGNVSVSAENVEELQHIQTPAVEVNLPAFDPSGIIGAMEQMAGSYQSVESTVNELCGTELPAIQKKLEGITAVKDQIPTASMQTLKESVSALNTGMQQLKGGIGQLSGSVNLLDQKTSVLPEAGKGIQALLDGFQNLGGANRQLLDGAAELKENAPILVQGVGALQGGTSEFSQGLDALSTELSSGASTLSANSGTLREGASVLTSGTGELLTGSNTLQDASGQVQDGISQLKDGAKTLKDGMKEFDEKGTKKMKDTIEDELGDVLDRLKALNSENCTYDTFSGKADNMNSNVKFIIETDAIETEE